MPNPAITTLYESAYASGSLNPTADDLWGNLPRSLGDVPTILEQRFKDMPPIPDKEFHGLQKIISETMQNYGVFTKAAREQLANWTPRCGTLEIGHQPLYFGGGSFFVGKVAFAVGLAGQLRPEGCEGLMPIYFVGDHDQVQNELVITRFPQSQSSTGLELKASYPEEQGQASVAYLPKPPEEELLDQSNKIRQNYRELFKYAKVKGQHRPLLEERLEVMLDKWYESYLQSSSYADWVARFWARVFVVRNQAPLLLLRASDPALRELMRPHFETLLQEENRERLVRTTNTMHDKIQQLGYDPQLGRREDDYVPFFLDCLQCPGKSRVRVKTTGKNLVGKCPTCGESFEVPYNPAEPDLSDLSPRLSPRVDSRSIIINQLLRTWVRVTGGGETGYYAQLIPYMREVGQRPPLVMKTPRVYYNTPWAEKTAEQINFDDLPTLHVTETYKRLGALAKASSYDELATLVGETKVALDQTYEQLKEAEEIYKEKLAKGKSKQLSRKLGLVQLYLSHTYGSYEVGKRIQEVSWNWMDLGILVSLNDLLGFYTRQLKDGTPLAPTFFLSGGKFS